MGEKRSEDRRGRTLGADREEKQKGRGHHEWRRARRQENKKQEVEWKNEGSGRRETVLWSDLCVTLASIKSKDSFGRRSGVSLSFLWVVEIDGLSPGYRRHNSASSPKGKSESHSRNPAQRLEWFLSYCPWPHFWWFPFMFCTFITLLNVFKCKRVLQQTLTTRSFSSEVLFSLSVPVPNSLSDRKWTQSRDRKQEAAGAWRRAWHPAAEKGTRENPLMTSSGPAQSCTAGRLQAGSVFKKLTTNRQLPSPWLLLLWLPSFT